MSVVILKWNPGFSSYTMFRFLDDLEKCALSNNGNIGMNWSIWEFDKVRKGDICYLLKVGYGQTGIVARGVITSAPYSGEDWSWRNRPTKYCDFNFEVMINPDAYPVPDSDMLTEAIPDFDWNGGHSGMVLSDQQADVLETLWKDYMQRQSEYFEKASDHNLFLLADSALYGEGAYSMKLDKEYSIPRIDIRFRKGDTTSSLVIHNYERVLGKFGVKSWRALNQLFRKQYPAPDSLSLLCGDLFRHQIEFYADFYRQSEPNDAE